MSKEEKCAVCNNNPCTCEKGPGFKLNVRWAIQIALIVLLNLAIWGYYSFNQSKENHEHVIGQMSKDIERMDKSLQMLHQRAHGEVMKNLQNRD